MKQFSKNQYTLIAFAALMLLIVLRFDSLSGMVGLVIGSMDSLLMGALAAFVLNAPMNQLEKLFDKVSFLKSVKRPLAIVSVLTIFLAVIALVFVIIIPTFTTTISQLVTVSNQGIQQLISWMEESQFFSNSLGEQVIQYITQAVDMSKISGVVTSFLNGLVSNVSGIFTNLLSLVMAFFFTLSILMSKEHLQQMTLKILYAFLPEKAVKTLSYIGKVTMTTYDKFLMSQIVEAVIIGFMVYIGYALSSLPYAGMAGILAGVLSFVPYIGPLMACLISALFIAVQSPILALWSLVLFQIIQIIEGNVIYPRVVGQSVGLPTLFTLAAALIGGNLFGLLGMVFFTPIFAVVYRLVKEWTNKRLADKQISLSSLGYTQGEGR